jgi:acetylornithine deacetylase/succinyl-diaminopimelate desuccinylase-like protein
MMHAKLAMPVTPTSPTTPPPARSASPGPRVNWPEIRAEATELLRAYVRLDTTNPPGGEEAGALLLRDTLARDGVASVLHDAGDSRVSLTARLPATHPGGGKPLVLLSHIDVVPAEREHWSVDPFAAELSDGVLWGRGTLDMKGVAVMQLLALALAKRHGVELTRDVVFVAVADEEEGGRKGVHFLRETAPQWLDAAWVLNEGAYGFREFMGQPATLFGLCPTEKSPCWLRLRASGRPGHASVPHADNAVVRLVRALARIEAREQQARLTPAVDAMFRTLRERGLVPEAFDPSDPGILEMLASADAHLGAVTHDTVNLTGLRAGHKHNVIPAAAEATLDCRLLPDTDPERFVAEIRRLVDDPAVEIERVLAHDSGQSSLDTPMVKVIGEVIRERYGEAAAVLPMLSPGFTDSHAYRAAGAEAYGFVPALLDRAELATIHGHDERISIDNLVLGTEILFEVVRRMAGPSR